MEALARHFGGVHVLVGLFRHLSQDQVAQLSARVYLPAGRPNSQVLIDGSKKFFRFWSGAPFLTNNAR